MLSVQFLHCQLFHFVERVLLSIFCLALSFNTPATDVEAPINHDHLAHQDVKAISQIYHASMAYIFSQQPLINAKSDKKDALFGRQFIEQVKLTYRDKYNAPFPNEQNEYIKRLVNLMMLVMEDNRTLLLDKEIGFKGFIPAIFAFQLSERFKKRGYGMYIKFTNVPSRIRNMLSSPDQWEQDALEKLAANETRFVFDTHAEFNGKQAVRYMEPVKLTPMCLSCHGVASDNPLNKGRNVSQWQHKDKTGFLMEGWKLGELGGGISVAVYDQ